MKRNTLTMFVCSLLAAGATSCNQRCIEPGIVPGSCCTTILDWRYSAGEIRSQTCRAASKLMDRWFATNSGDRCGDRPRILIIEVSNRTDCYIPHEIVRHAMEEAASDDGRFTIIVGDPQEKYKKPYRRHSGQTAAPEFLGKICLSKTTACDLEEYRLVIELYDLETQTLVDCAEDILYKKLRVY